MLHNTLTRITTSLAFLALAGCASQTPTGYGVMASQSTAAQAQEQLAAAEQANQPDAAQTYLDLIAQMQQAGQWYASLAHADAFEAQHGARPQSSLLRADALRNTGQSEAARSAYQQLLGTSSAARAQRGLGLLYASEGQYTQAIAQLEQARQLNPIDASLLSDIAYAHMLDGNLNAARVPILQAAQLAPANARVQLNLALYWLATGQQDEANRLLQRLSQPQSKGAAPLIDQSSTQMLQRQLSSVQQAAMARNAAVMPTAAAGPASTVADTQPRPSLSIHTDSGLQ
ncbi:tetratricopeptide repeat protein [Lampropedia puyangensis]|uniref:Tetratricopeptide repeat protein n=1 Tax=Lampropedia puyangensis TaxID=1330072 RepID=A0A4S8F1M2_9BURK|nr:tetratricopeptide repeat protein [Lampropedia puyangensis]THT99963.1 tetratricopeptide repeat protein [Lampropedia puyangensis]